MDDCFSKRKKKPAPEIKAGLNSCGGRGTGPSSVLPWSLFNTLAVIAVFPRSSRPRNNRKISVFASRSSYANMGNLEKHLFFFHLPVLLSPPPLFSFSSTSDGVEDILKQTCTTSSSSWFQYPPAPRSAALLGNNDNVDNIYSDAECVCALVCARSCVCVSM